MATVAVDRRRRFRLDTETAAPLPLPLSVRVSGLSRDKNPESPGAGVPLASLPCPATPSDIGSVGMLTPRSSEPGPTTSCLRTLDPPTMGASSPDPLVGQPYSES